MSGFTILLVSILGVIGGASGLALIIETDLPAPGVVADAEAEVDLAAWADEAPTGLLFSELELAAKVPLFEGTVIFAGAGVATADLGAVVAASFLVVGATAVFASLAFTGLEDGISVDT